MKLFYTLSLVFFGALQTAQGYVECTKDTDCEKICANLGATQYFGPSKYSCEKPLASSIQNEVCIAHKTSGGGSIMHVCGGEEYDLTTCVEK